MSSNWSKIAQRSVQGLAVQAGQQILIRDHCGRSEVVFEMALAVEQAGATPLVDMHPPDYVRRLIGSAPAEALQNWDHHRQRWLEQSDGILQITGGILNGEGLPQAPFQAWQGAFQRLTELEEARRLPFLLLTVPNEDRARLAGMSLAALESLVLPALAASAEELMREIRPVLAAVQGGRTLTLRSGDSCELHLALGDRPWLSDDGVIDAEDRARGAVVSNLPAGSIYTTVLESETRGSLFLPGAMNGQDALLRFADGRVYAVEGAAADAFNRMLDSESGEPRRISHIGIALNPYLRRPCNWIIVDEHIYGRVFIALGENRYMGGQNESSLNIDFSLPGTTLVVDQGLQGERCIVEDGAIV